MKTKLKPDIKNAFIDILTEYYYFYKFMGKASAKEAANKQLEQEETDLYNLLCKVFIDYKLNGFEIKLTTKPLKHSYRDLFKRGHEAFFDIGNVTITLSQVEDPKMSFGNTRFHHGHILADGKLKCRGQFRDFRQQMTEVGVVSTIISLFVFAQNSQYGTYESGE